MSSGTERVERKLAAIFCADVADYSRLMHADEVQTLRTLTAHRAIMDGLIAQHGGRIANTAGDSVLAEFRSVVDAVECAAAVQERLGEAIAGLPDDKALRFRIGVHVGDVMVRGGDLLGDGVNVAARVQGLAESGGVAISGRVYEEVEGKLSFGFEDRGEQQVKNIARSVRVYALTGAAPSISEPKALPLSDKPSIAVLPFTNMSGDPEQEYFCDGLVEDIITSLSRFASLFVTARTSSFTYKGRSVSVQQIGRELGVRYVLEGSIRKAGSRVRITGQLVDAASGNHLWADRFDGDLTQSIFNLQDEMTANVVGVIHPTIEEAEIEAATRKRPSSLSAYDLYLRALSCFRRMGRSALEESIELLNRALILDPKYSAAAALAAVVRGYQRAAGFLPDTREDREERLRLVRLALDNDPNDLDVLGHCARQLSYMGADFEAATEMADRATSIYPNSAFAWNQRGWVYMYCARPAEAVEFLHRAVRLSPRDPMQYDMLCGLALALVQLERYDEAIEAARRSAGLNPYFSSTQRALVAAFAHLQRQDEAQQAAQHLLQLEPGFTISDWDARTRWKYSAKGNIAAGLRLAGLPE